MTTQKTMPQQPKMRLGRLELIALIAALIAINSIAIDIMLPGLQQIGASLGVTDENHRQYVISAYLFGFGFFQLLYGPISDRFGRRPPLLFGLAVFVVSAIGAALSPTFAMLLAFRALQGAGAAATRVVAVSVVRDIFEGRQMAEVMSLVMMVFMILPIVAPATGQLIMLFGEWHLIFAFMAVMAFVIALWTFFRLPETLHPGDRRSLTLASIVGGFGIVLSNRVAVCYTLAASFIFGSLFGFINSASQIYLDIYKLGQWFPLAFAGVAATMALASFINSRLVGRFGMRRISHSMLVAFVAISLVWLLLSMRGIVPFPLYMALFAAIMFCFGLIGANFNSLAMEPLGKVAGTASAVLGFTQTLIGAAIGAVIGQTFDGTTVPISAGYFVLGAIGLIFVLIAERGKLFQAQNKPAAQVIHLD
ncbi:multidrug effflux MFS transporter [Phyllobacterium leguminum]|uniref:Bcr/CflA family efflux transporter n=1 Tax=Phyllobacterium leguminum TaxID=314237 RepID=A0A318T8W6_9HYPH|nr:multidrug effflux MFS transporter [Phyllobacterium leguminum]PYE89751.1 DHA1 family bicyclomycin/chloramphenicol resistance-like MFS transporter [Phyllobacterium leguminum]